MKVKVKLDENFMKRKLITFDREYEHLENVIETLYNMAHTGDLLIDNKLANLYIGLNKELEELKIIKNLYIERNK